MIENHSDSLELSVIVPVFNRKDYYMQALESITNQTCVGSLVEIIIVSNILLKEGIEGKGVELKVIYSDDESLSGKIITGVLNASGEVVAFLEDDDLWEIGKIDSLLRAFEGDNALDFYHNGHTYFHHQSQKWKRTSSNNIDHNKQALIFLNGKDVINSNRSYNLLIKNQASYNLSSMALRRSFIMLYLNYFENFGNDFIDGLIFLLSTIFGRKLAIENTKFTKIRLHPTNRSGLDINRGNDHYKDSFDRVIEISSSKVINSNINQFITRIKVDGYLKSIDYSRFDLLKLFLRHIIASFSCIRFPDRDIVIKTALALVSPSLLRKFLVIYHGTTSPAQK